MKVYEGLKDIRLKPQRRSVAIGIFDGVHRGHQKIIRQLIVDARRFRALPLVVTFEPHPNKILKPKNSHPILMSLPHRLRLFEKLGVAETVIVRFNKNFARVSREQFLEEGLIKRLGMRSLAVGHDFRFGYQGRGDTDFLRERAGERDFGLRVVPPLKYGRSIISSTRIRRLIERGQLKTAARMLGRPVSVYGTVVAGHGRGRKIGFPTANLNPHHETLPPSGVYAAWGYFDGRRLKGIIHIGERPTFNEKERSLEVHFLEFNEDIYGREVELIFVMKLRNIRHFSSPKLLAGAIKRDAQKAVKILKKPLQTASKRV